MKNPELKKLEETRDGYAFCTHYDHEYDLEMSTVNIRQSHYRKGKESKETEMVWTHVVASKAWTIPLSEAVGTRENLTHVEIKGSKVYENENRKLYENENGDTVLEFENEKLTIPATIEPAIAAISHEPCNDDEDDFDQEDGSWWRGDWHSEDDW